MVRSFALTFAAVTLRLYLPIAVFAFGFEFNSAYSAIAWLAWVAERHRGGVLLDAATIALSDLSAKTTCHLVREFCTAPSISADVNR